MGNLKLITNVRKVYHKLLAERNDVAFCIFLKRYRIKVMTSLKTIRYIQKHQCSVSRYGDGELSMILKGKNIGFQKNDQVLCDRLKEVLFADNRPRLLLCLPHMFQFFDGECPRAKDFWKSYLISNKNTVVKLLRTHHMGEYCFGDTQMTRPYIDYSNSKHAKRIYREIKKLWNNRNLLIVEGFATHMGMGNDLFDNASSIKRIICPAENAFECYEKIYATVLEKYSGELVLIALGPTATVLASDLSNQGIWAIDVGHLDVEYEWYLNGATEKTAIQGKYVNEVSGGKVLDDTIDEKYSNQVIARVTN